MGGYERDPAPFGLDGIPDGFEAQLLTEDWDRFEELMAGRAPAGAGDRARGGQALLQRPRGVHARRRVHPRRERGARVLGGGRLLRARTGRSGWDRQGHGRVDRRGRARVRPLAHGHPPLRPPLPIAALRARPHHRGLLAVLRHPLSGPGARGGAAAARLRRPIRGCASSAPPSARSRAGSVRTGSSRTPPAATSRCARAAGPGGTGRPRSARSASRPAMRPRSSTSPRSRRSTCTAPVRSRSSTVSART